MSRAAVRNNSIELAFTRAEAVLLAVSAVLVVALAVLGGWKVAGAALGLSLLGAMAVRLVQDTFTEDWTIKTATRERTPR